MQTHACIYILTIFIHNTKYNNINLNVCTCKYLQIYTVCVCNDRCTKNNTVHILHKHKRLFWMQLIVINRLTALCMFNFSIIYIYIYMNEWIIHSYMLYIHYINASLIHIYIYIYVQLYQSFRVLSLLSVSNMTLTWQEWLLINSVQF